MDQSLRPAEAARRARMGQPVKVVDAASRAQGEHLSNLYSTVLVEASEEARVRHRLLRIKS